MRVLDGDPLVLNQVQLDKLDARIDGVVTITDTSTNLGNLLDNAVSTSIQQITSPDTLAIKFEQFRNLPTYYSDIVIKDTEDNIVAALNVFLDDRVKLCITSQSTTLGKTGVGDDSSITVTAAAAKNILNKRFILKPTLKLVILRTTWVLV